MRRNCSPAISSRDATSIGLRSFLLGEKSAERFDGIVSPGSFRDAAKSAFTRVFDAPWRRPRNPSPLTVRLGQYRGCGFRALAFGGPRNDQRYIFLCCAFQCFSRLAISAGEK